jgi:centromeric protein E
MPQLLNSLMSLTRERKMLSKQVHKKFSRRGREELYLKWGIDLKTKHRSIQLAWLVWSDTRDLNHIRESAALVGKLVGFINTGEASKKTFGLGFLTRLRSRGSPNWNDTMSTL